MHDKTHESMGCCSRIEVGISINGHKSECNVGLKISTHTFHSTFQLVTQRLCMSIDRSPVHDSILVDGVRPIALKIVVEIDNLIRDWFN